MAAKIERVIRHSPAHRAGIKKGETLLKINGENVTDVLDYRFLSYDPKLNVVVEDGQGIKREVNIKKEDGEDLGVSFSTYLIDEMRQCRNRCVFCFIDQLPRGMRKSLYVKDDDARMSFLLGNYISLTNLSDTEVDRIIKMRISPVNISVHTTNPALREKMLGNKKAGKSLSILKKFHEAGIRMNMQIVVCPGLNDGEELKNTLTELISMVPAVLSISVVPVGLTKYREGLFPLLPVNREIAREILNTVCEYGDRCLKLFDSRIVYPADELFLKAGLEIPEASFYEDFPQYENGVGMLSLFWDKFREKVDAAVTLKCKPFTAITGEATATFLQSAIDYASLKCDNLIYEVFPIVNNFFGRTVDVTGLVTGGDIISEFKAKKPSYRVLVPANMLRYDRDMFLDSVTVDDLRGLLDVPLDIIDADGGAFFSAVFEVMT